MKKKIQRKCFSVMSFDYVLIFLMNFEVFIHIFCNLNFVRTFKFVFSCQPLYYYIHKVLKRCSTERYIKPVRIPGYLWYTYKNLSGKCFVFAD